MRRYVCSGRLKSHRRHRGYVFRALDHTAVRGGEIHLEMPLAITTKVIPWIGLVRSLAVVGDVVIPRIPQRPVVAGVEFASLEVQNIPMSPVPVVIVTAELQGIGIE